MTIARDIRTGQILGRTVAYVTPLATDKHPPIMLLTPDGRYVTVPRSSVRLEMSKQSDQDKPERKLPPLRKRLVRGWDGLPRIEDPRGPLWTRLKEV